jgi:hypothetical protein
LILESWTVFVQITTEQKEILSSITSRLLNSRAGTPLTPLRRRLGPRRKILDDLLIASLLRTLGDCYLPTFRGVEQLDDNIRNIVHSNLNAVLHGIRELYAGDDRSTFGFNVIVEETRRQNPTLDDNDVLPALILGDELDLYYFSQSIRWDEHHLAVDEITVTEKILDFTFVQDHWNRLLREEAERERKASQVAASITETSLLTRAPTPTTMILKTAVSGWHRRADQCFQ